MTDVLNMDHPQRFETIDLLSLRFNLFANDEPHEYSTEPIPFIRFAYVQEGYADFMADGQQPVRAQVGSVVYVPARLGYRSVWPVRSRLFVADLYVSDFATAEQNYGDEIRVLFTDRRGVLEQSVVRLSKSTAANQPYLWMERVSIVMHILCEIARTQSEESARQSRINQSILYMKYNFEKDTTVEELAAMCSFSVSQFRRLFEEYFGVSPVEYRNRLRITHAQEMIRRGDYTAAQAAQMVGIEDVKYFTRLYKKYTGETPGKARRRQPAR